MDHVELGGETAVAEELQVGEENRTGGRTGGAQCEGLEPGFIVGLDALPGAELRDNFAKVPRQRTRPA